MKSIKTISGIIATTFLLTACIEDDDSSDSHDDHGGHEEHAHALMISQSSNASLSFLEEDELESLDDDAAGNGAELLLSNAGMHAAIITDSQVQFVAAHHEDHEEGEAEEGEANEEDEHELPEVISITGLTGTNIEVVNTKGHFSVLVDGKTMMVPYESLEEGETPAAEDLELGVIETDPALLLEETTDEKVALVFAGGTATIYENGVADMDLSETCTTVNSVAHGGGEHEHEDENETRSGDDEGHEHEFAVVSCTNGATDVTYSVKFEHPETDGAEHVIEIETIADISTAVEWKTSAGKFVGLGADNKIYVVEESVVDDEATLAVATDKSFDAPANLCGWGLDSLKGDIFTLTASATKTELTVSGHDFEKTIQLDESATTTCKNAQSEDNFVMATAAQAVFVLDNVAMQMFEIDREEDATSYHIHSREALTVSDVASAVSLHEVGEHDDDE